MIFLPGDSTLCGKFPIINSQHPHWITVTTSGNHHDPTTKEETITNTINPKWMLLDTCSTISSNRKNNIFKASKPVMH